MSLRPKEPLSNQELRSILDRGLAMWTTSRDGEYDGTDWDWKASVEGALRDYFAAHPA